MTKKLPTGPSTRRTSSKAARLEALERKVQRLEASHTAASMIGHVVVGVFDALWGPKKARAIEKEDGNNEIILANPRGETPTGSGK